MTVRRLLLVHPTRLDGENHGVYIQHVASMQWLLTPADGWDVVPLDPLHPAFAELALTSDLVIVHMLAAREIEPLIRLRRERGLKTLVEIGDNFLDLGTWLPKKHSLRNPLIRQHILYHASISDGVQVYSRGLAELFRHVHRDVLVLDPYVPLSRREPSDGSFVLGWGGTTSHAADVERIAPVIVAFCQRHPDAVFAYMGDSSLFARLFGRIPIAQTRVRKFGPYDEYLEFVSSLDVGLAPLGASGFNAGRTDTKFATYAARGVAALLEDSDVYREHADRAVLFASPEELETQLESLYADPQRRAQIAERAYEWAVRERGAEHLRAQRMRAYERLCHPERESRDPGGRGARQEPHAPPAEVPRLTLGMTPEHARLSAALLVKDPDTSLAELEQIVREYPHYTQARLALCRAYETRREYARAFALLDGVNFPGIYADEAAEMQANLARRVKPDDASQYDARIASPVARVRLDHRDGDRRRYFDALLARQPYDYLALATLIRELLAHDPSSPQLPELCLRACLIAPELVPVEHRPASLARFLPA
jgi:hypothetical protein